MMGVLGPVMVLGGWWDNVRQSRVAYDQAVSQYDTAHTEWGHEQDRAKRLNNERVAREYPEPSQWVVDGLWRGFSPDITKVRVGQWWASSDEQGQDNRGLVLVDYQKGLALVGGPESAGVWRNLVLQWCAATQGGQLARQLSESGHLLPRDIHGVSRLVWVTTMSDVPAEIQSVIVLGQEATGTVSTPGEAAQHVRCDVASHPTLTYGLRKLSPPDHNHHAPSSVDVTRRDQLWFQLSEGGPLWDLVACGPHAVVWGATGSGKSVSLVSLISSMVNRYSPKDLALVVIDFKGGAGLRPLAKIPHTIGWVTDLDSGKSQRVMAGLRTEMVKREKILASAGVSDIAVADGQVTLPRLLVVVDEVAWLLTNHPEWADVLADVLARGRSLGIHLVLSTQRVSGVLTRAMMANIALRVCGLVRDEQELSEWMPGVSKEVAANAIRMTPGEVVMSATGEYPTRHQVGTLEPRERSLSPSTWRVWVDDLPTVHPWSPSGFGLVECVEAQTHTDASYVPADGSLAVVGDPGSGRTHAVWAVMGLFPRTCLAPPTPGDTWLALKNLSGSDTALAIDDVDILVHQAGADGEAFLLEALENFRGTLIVSMNPGHRAARHIARFIPHTLLLSMNKPEQASLWQARPSPIPGRGLWLGNVVQVGFTAAQPRVWSEAKRPLDPANTVVVSEEPDVWASSGCHRVMTLEAFSSAYAKRSLGVSDPTVVWDRVSHREVRFATGGVSHIPPLDLSAGNYWTTSAGDVGVMRLADWLH